MYTNYEWVDTNLEGTLKVLIMEEICEKPVAFIELYNVDKDDNELELIFQYEVPINFKHECDLTYNFYAMGLMEGHALGFMFEMPMEKEQFAAQMDILRRRLVVPKNKFK